MSGTMRVIGNLKVRAKTATDKMNDVHPVTGCGELKPQRVKMVDWCILGTYRATRTHDYHNSLGIFINASILTEVIICTHVVRPYAVLPEAIRQEVVDTKIGHQ